MSILFHRPTPWSSDITCSTKIFARYFKKFGFNVAYLEIPLDIGHILKWRGYFHNWKASPRMDEGVWVINPFTLMPVRDVYPLNTILAANASYKLCIPSIARSLAKGGFEIPDVIWAARPGSSVLKTMFPNSLLVVQVVDYYPAFRGDYIKSIERYDYQAADHIFLIGHAMVDYLVGELEVPREKITVLGQGVDIERYSRQYDCPDEILDAPSPRAIWVGVMGKGDQGMFRETAKNMRDIGGSLILIGTGSDWAVEIEREFDNVYLLGAKSPEDVPAYLTNSDIGLMLYDQQKENVYKGQNPLKLYEYAAAGLVIISTCHKEYEYILPPVIEIQKSVDIPNAISTAVNNREKYKALSLSFAAKYTWENVFSRANNIIYRLRQEVREINGT